MDISKINNVVHTASFRFQLAKAFSETFDEDEISFIIDAIKQRVNRNLKGGHKL